MRVIVQRDRSLTPRAEKCGVVRAERTVDTGHATRHLPVGNVGPIPARSRGPDALTRINIVAQIDVRRAKIVRGAGQGGVIIKLQLHRDVRLTNRKTRGQSAGDEAGRTGGDVAHDGNKVRVVVRHTEIGAKAGRTIRRGIAHRDAVGRCAARGVTDVHGCEAEIRPAHHGARRMRIDRDSTDRKVVRGAAAGYGESSALVGAHGGAVERKSGRVRRIAAIDRGAANGARGAGAIGRREAKRSASGVHHSDVERQ